MTPKIFCSMYKSRKLRKQLPQARINSKYCKRWSEFQVQIMKISVPMVPEIKAPSIECKLY